VKGITKAGRKELRWALVEASWQAIRANPRWRADYAALCKRKHPNQAIVIARKLGDIIFLNGTRLRRSSDEDLAYKMLTWAGA
jgi:transposase